MTQIDEKAPRTISREELERAVASYWQDHPYGRQYTRHESMARALKTLGIAVEGE